MRRSPIKPRSRSSMDCLEKPASENRRYSSSNRSMMGSWAVQRTWQRPHFTQGVAVSGGKKSMDEIYKKDDKGRYVYSAAERQQALAESMAQNE